MGITTPSQPPFSLIQKKHFLYIVKGRLSFFKKNKLVYIQKPHYFSMDKVVSLPLAEPSKIDKKNDQSDSPLNKFKLLKVIGEKFNEKKEEASSLNS